MSEQAIDRAIYEELVQTTDPEFVGELVDTFLEDGRTLLVELRSARTDRHADRFRRAAHSLKTSANTFGATGLGTLARGLEIKGLDGEEARDLAAIAALELEFERAAAELLELRLG